MQGLRIQELISKLRLSKTKIYALIIEKKLPRPRKAGRASIWIEEEVDIALKNLAKTVAATNKKGASK